MTGVRTPGLELTRAHTPTISLILQARQQYQQCSHYFREALFQIPVLINIFMNKILIAGLCDNDVEKPKAVTYYVVGA